jgi:hypothetical protein
MSETFLENFAVGQVYGSRRVTVDQDRTKTFAAEFDRQRLRAPSYFAPSVADYLDYQKSTMG